MHKFFTIKTSQSRLNQKGQSVVEYLIIVAIMAVGSLAIFRTLSETTNYKFAQIAEKLGAKADADLSRPTITSTAVKKRDMTNFMQGAMGSEPGNK